MSAFTGFGPKQMTDPLHPTAKGPGKYGSFDYSRLQALDPSNAPSPPRVASQGALPAGQAPAASSAPPAGAFMPADEGKGKGEARKPGKGRSFFDIWSQGSMEEKLEIAEKQENILRDTGTDLESKTKELLQQGGEPARLLAERFGIVGTEEDGLAFRDPAVVLDERSRKGKKKLDKAQKKAAMGGFLMEMGLRILQSDRDDAGGAIAEGALGTMDARRQRKIEAEDRSIAKAELERQRAQQEAERRRQEERLKLERRRVEDAEARTALQREEFESPEKSRNPYQFEVMQDAYMQANAGGGKSEQELQRDFLSWYKGESKLPKIQVARLIDSTLERFNDNITAAPQGWEDMTAEEKKQWVLDYYDLEKDDVSKGSAADDPLGLFSD